jgi:hypothetical protein
MMVEEDYKKGKNAANRGSFTPDSAPPALETDDSGQVLTLPPNQTAKASRASFGGNTSGPCHRAIRSFFGTARRLLMAAAPLPRNLRIADGRRERK